jgi:hypothetical protein
MHTTDTKQRVTTSNPAILDDLLSSAEDRIIPYALALNHGIRVTRVGPGDFIVQTAEDVACGYTVQGHT